MAVSLQRIATLAAKIPPLGYLHGIQISKTENPGLLLYRSAGPGSELQVLFLKRFQAISLLENSVAPLPARIEAKALKTKLVLIKKRVRNVYYGAYQLKTVLVD